MADRDNDASGKTNHKHVGAKAGMDVTQGTKRRVEQAVSIRHKNRLEQLNKRRKEDDEDDQADGTIGRFPGAASSASAGAIAGDGDEDTQRQTNHMFSRIAEFCRMMDPSNPPAVVSEGVWSIRRLLCHPTRSPLADLTRCGGIEALIALLDAPDPNIQYNAAWSLTNISSGATAYAHMIIRCGAIPKFIRFLECPVEKLREQAAWCLGNMAGDGSALRDQILDAGIIPPLLKCINGDNENIATLRNAVWLLAQLCRNKPSPSFELLEPCIPTVRALLTHPVTQIQDDACWAVSYLSDGPPARIEAVMSYGVMPLVMDLLRTRRETVMLPAVRTFGNFSATNPEMTQIIIEEGVLDHLAPLLDVDEVPRQIRKEVCWLISNACAGFDGQVVAVMDAGLFPPVIANIYTMEFEVRREAVWVVANATATASVARIRYLTEECDVLDALSNVLATMDSRICNIALESIEAILLVGDSFREGNGGRNPYADRLEEIGGRANIARLRDHICHTVFLRSATLMERYFEGEWDPSALAPGGGGSASGDEVGAGQVWVNPIVPPAAGGGAAHFDATAGAFRNGHGNPFVSVPAPHAPAPAPGSSHIPAPPNQAMVFAPRSSGGGGGASQQRQHHGGSPHATIDG